MEINIPVSENISCTDELLMSDGCKEILNKPLFVSASSGDTRSMLYSYEQMTKIYSLGKQESSTDSQNFVIKIKPYSIMKDMKVGDSLDFTADKWGAARTAASALKRKFNYRYRVYKVIDENGDSKITVNRTL